MSNTLGTKRLGTVLALIVAFAIALAMIVTPAAHAQEDAQENHGGAGVPAAVASNEAQDYPANTEHFAKAADVDGNIQDKLGYLTVHKYTGSTDATSSNGKKIDITESAARKPLAGATFQLYKVTKVGHDDQLFDLLNTAANWNTLADHKAELVVEGSGVPTEGAKVKYGTTNIGEVHKLLEQETSDKGIAQFRNLPVGLYYVVESAAPTNVTEKVKPFFVTVPFPHTEATHEWNYDVHVYPKNEISEVTKTVDETATQTLKNGEGKVIPNNQITWNLTALLPKFEDKNPGDTVKPSFKFTDTLDSRLKYVTDPASKIEIVPADGSTNIELVSGTDYTLPNANATDTIEFPLTDAGVAKLTGHEGDKIKLTFTAEIKDPTALTSSVPNADAGVDFDNDGDENHTTTKITETPKAYYGKITVKKHVEGQETHLLAGAVFRVYAAKADADASNDNFLQEVKTGTDGLAVFNNLYVGKTANATKQYYVKEITAPAGYVLPADSIDVTLTASGDPIATADQKVPNTPHKTGDLPDLPLTGASGKLLMTLGGAAIVLFAAGTVLVTRRRKA